MTLLMRVVVVSLGAVVVAGALVGWRVHERGHAVPQATCGSAVTHDLDAQTQLLSADPGTLVCFRAAAASCRSASIKVIEMGVDAASDYVFIIEPGTRPCQVSELRQFSLSFGGPAPGPVSRVRCALAAVTASGVVLSCSGRVILIPGALSGCSPRYPGLRCTPEAGPAPGVRAASG